MKCEFIYKIEFDLILSDLEFAMLGKAMDRPDLQYEKEKGFWFHKIWERESYGPDRPIHLDKREIGYLLKGFEFLGQDIFLKNEEDTETGILYTKMKGFLWSCLKKRGELYSEIENKDIEII